jgi:hypothetical protein
MLGPPFGGAVAKALPGAFLYDKTEYPSKTSRKPFHFVLFVLRCE